MKRSAFLEPYSLALRIWHWLTFLVIGFLLLTVLIAEVFLSEEEVPANIQKTLTQDNVIVSSEQASHVNEMIRENVWEWHTIVGYVLLGLLIYRIVLEFFQPADQRFIRKMKLAFSDKSQPMRKQYLFAKLTYIFFYALLTVVVFTGVWLALKEDEKTNKLYSEIKEIHEISFYMILVFIFLHLGGVIWAEIKHSKGIVSNMINGGKSF
jgi:Ni/Fe-hydrogenase 1 B-type cytochrome subunit